MGDRRHCHTRARAAMRLAQCCLAVRGFERSMPRWPIVGRRCVVAPLDAVATCSCERDLGGAGEAMGECAHCSHRKA